MSSDRHGPDDVLKQAQQALDGLRYAEAESLQRQGIELLTAQRADPVRITNELEKLADVHFVQEKFELAAGEYDRVRKARQNQLPAGDDKVLNVSYWLAKSYFKAQKYEKAESVLADMIPVVENQPESSAKLALFLYEMGFLLYFVGRYAEAESYLLRALPLYEENRGESHLETIEIVERIALTYRWCPDIGKDPEPYFRRAVELSWKEQNLHQTYVENLCRLAEYIADHKRYEEADALFTEIASMVERQPSLGSGAHWVTSACVEYFRGRGQEAAVAQLAEEDKTYNAFDDMLEQRLKHAEETLAEDDPERAAALFDSGNNAIFKGEYKEAETLHRRALAVFAKIDGEESEAVLKCLNRLAVTIRLLDRLDEADALLQRALEIARNRFLHADIYAYTLENIALIREAQSRPEEATALYQEAVSAYEEVHGFPARDTLEALYRLSGLQWRTGQLGLAETTLRRVIDAMDSVKELSLYERSDYVGALASVVDARGRKTEAEQLSTRAKDMLEQARTDVAEE